MVPPAPWASGNPARWQSHTQPPRLPCARCRKSKLLAIDLVSAVAPRLRHNRSMPERKSERKCFENPHLRRDLDHADSHNTRLSPAKSGIVFPFHWIRMLPYSKRRALGARKTHHACRAHGAASVKSAASNRTGSHVPTRCRSGFRIAACRRRNCCFPAAENSRYLTH